MNIIEGRNIDVSKITFRDPKYVVGSFGECRNVNLIYDGTDASFQTPWMSMPWDMDIYTRGAHPKYSVNLSFNDIENNPELKEFHDKIIEVEEKIIDAGIENSICWLKKKKCSRDFVDKLFSRILKKDNIVFNTVDGKRHNVIISESTMNFKIYRNMKCYTNSDDWRIKVSDKNGKLYNIHYPENSDDLEELFKKKTRMRAIIKCEGLFLRRGVFVCNWMITSAEID
jgi:hypothetical protein